MSLLIQTPTPSHHKEVASEEVIKSKKVQFKLLREVFLPSRNKVTSVAVVSFVEKNKMVAVRLKRGADIPGGHVETYDQGLTDTVRREAMEEAGIELGENIHLIGVIASNYKGPSRDDITYMLITASNVSRILKNMPESESEGRAILDIDDFLSQYRAGSPQMMEEILSRARRINDEFLSRKSAWS